MRSSHTFLWALLCALLSTAPVGSTHASEALQPYSLNPFYWQYKGQPVAIFGASDDDNLFQWDAEELIEHLDEISAAGGNQLRNVMSSRDDGNLQPFKLIAAGTYDLDQWNDTYWSGLDRLLSEAHARQMFVQIEIWDRFDFHSSPWLLSAFNPTNNINYTEASSNLEADYPDHGSTEKNPFLQTVPDLLNNTVVLEYQEAFVKKLVATAAPYDNVLFCISNETRLPEAWSNYWAELVEDEADTYDRSFPITEMLDDRDVTNPVHDRSIENESGLYSFVDISQNSWQIGDTNWDNAQFVRNRLLSTPKPINHTKIYGCEQRFNGTGQNSEADAIETFWRNLLGGLATSRFHRPATHGVGLNANTIVQLNVARGWVGQFDLFRAQPDATHSLISGRSAEEVYMSYIPQEKWTLLFPNGGSIQLSTGTTQAKRIRWANLETGAWTTTSRLPDGTNEMVNISTPDTGRWLAVVELAPSSNFDFSAWQSANFTSVELAQSSISGSDATPNNDGIPNRIKHVLGYGPYDSVQLFSSAHRAADGRPGFEFQKNADLDGFPIVIETATTLGNWDSGSDHYTFEIVGMAPASIGRPSLERIRIRPPKDFNSDQWFTRLVID